MMQINPIKLILLYYSKILICKVRVTYEADPVTNSTDKEASATIDELAVATDP